MAAWPLSVSTVLRTCYYVRLWELFVVFVFCDVLTGSSVDGSENKIGYKYLDSDLYHVPVITNIPSIPQAAAEEEFQKIFPKPPMFPPPPPSMDDDVNALLRRTIFNHMEHGRLKGDSGDNSGDESGNSSHNDHSTWNPCFLLDNHHQASSLQENGHRHHHQNRDVTSDGFHNGFTDDTVTGQNNETCSGPGPKGDRGQRGRRGRRGYQGEDGPPGPQGEIGPVGPRGVRGYQGPPGVEGKAGPVGPRGSRGHPGYPGIPGTPGSDGANGIPGLVIFPDAATMYGVELEGLIAYRSDVKILYFRDNITWRPVRITRCGDGILDRDMDEECDDGNGNDNDDCVGCKKAVCGDGVRHDGVEECDGRDFGSKRCDSWRPGMVGPVQCSRSCRILYHRCRLPRR